MMFHLSIPSIRSEHLDTRRLIGVVAREVHDAMVVSSFIRTSLLSGDDVVPLEDIAFFGSSTNVLHGILYYVPVLLPQTLNAQVRRHAKRYEVDQIRHEALIETITP